MKIAPFLVSAVLNAIVAQRLVRHICLDCLASYSTPPETARLIARQYEELRLPKDTPIPKTLFKGKGCPACGHTGYHGRMGIYEVLRVTEPIRQYILDPQFSLDGLREQARKDGMRTMFEDGILKASQGKTTIDEILRVIRE